MSKQKLTIETTLKLDDVVITTPPITRNIWVDDAHSATVTVPKDAPGCKACFRVNAGLQDLLKFFLLQPKAKVDADKGEKADEVIKKGFKFYTSDPYGNTEDNPIDLTDTLVFTDNQIALLYGENQKELQKITFINHTGHDVDVKIIQGRDWTPCDEEDSTCAHPDQAQAK